MITPTIIVLLLLTPVIVTYLLGRFMDYSFSLQKSACWGLGLAFVFFAMGHAVKTAGMVDMLPPWVPMRVALVYLTGLVELLIAVMLFIPRFQVLGAKIAIAVLVVFFPANIYAAFHSIGLGGHQWGPVYLLIRTPLQLLVIAWAYCLCIKGERYQGEWLKA